MEIISIVFNSVSQKPLVVKTIDFLTDEVVVFNIERSDDGKIVDCRFGQPEFLLFIGEENFDFDEILKTREFTFNGELIKVGKENDPRIILNLNEIMSALPPEIIAKAFN